MHTDNLSAQVPKGHHPRWLCLYIHYFMPALVNKWRDSFFSKDYHGILLARATVNSNFLEQHLPRSMLYSTRPSVPHLFLLILFLSDPVSKLAVKYRHNGSPLINVIKAGNRPID